MIRRSASGRRLLQRRALHHITFCSTSPSHHEPARTARRPVCCVQHLRSFGMCLRCSSRQNTSIESFQGLRGSPSCRNATVPPNRPGLRFRSCRGLTSQREPVPKGRPRQDPGHPDWRFCPRVHYFQFVRCRPHKEQKRGPLGVHCSAIPDPRTSRAPLSRSFRRGSWCGGSAPGPARHGARWKVHRGSGIVTTHMKKKQGA